MEEAEGDTASITTNLGTIATLEEEEEEEEVGHHKHTATFAHLFVGGGKTPARGAGVKVERREVAVRLAQGGG